MSADSSSSRSERRAPSWRHRWLSRYYRGREHPGRLRILRGLKWLLAVDRIRVAIAPGVILDLNEDDFVQREILLYGAYEPLSVGLVERLLQETAAKVFVDVGAHIGQYSLRAARVLAGRGQVVAFEPAPGNAAHFQKNLWLSGLDNVTLFACGISDRARLAAMAQLHPRNSGGTAIVERSGPISHYGAFVSLAEALSTAGIVRVDVMKIDAEGHEPAVLRSVLALGPARPRHVLVEFLPASFAYDDDIPALLRAGGYTLQTVEGRPFRAGEPLPESNLWAVLTPP